MKKSEVERRCELLSNHYLCANKNSVFLFFPNPPGVVNCFQIIIFVLTRTAGYAQHPMFQPIRNIIRNKKMLFFKTI